MTKSELNKRYAELPLRNGGVTIVDADLFDWLSEYTWTRYAGGDVGRGENHKIIRIHRVINQTPPGFETDHINGDKLDNRRANLRTATKTQNAMNSSSRVNSTSRFKGVWWHRKYKKWYAGIRVKRKLIHLGSYDYEIQAAEAYNDAALHHFGEFSKLNQIPQDEIAGLHAAIKALEGMNGKS